MSARRFLVLRTEGLTNLLITLLKTPGQQGNVVYARVHLEDFNYAWSLTT